MPVAANEIKTVMVKDFLNTLVLLKNHLRLYASANNLIDLTTKRMFGFLKPLFADADDLTIYVGRHAFIYEEQFIDRTNRNFETFANRLFQHGVAAVTFNQGVTAAQIQTFLMLVERKPASSWDEGGVAAALKLRNVQSISVQEMSELDFSLGDVAAEEMASATGNSPLWQKFALSIVHGLHGDDALAGEGGASPQELAAAVNLLLEQSNGSKDELLARDLSRFLLSLKHEKIRSYRTATLNALTAFVNALTPNVRDLFVRNVFNLNVDAELTAELLLGMPDQVIMEALRNAAMDPGYAPPVVLQLLGRLAAERGLAAATELEAAGKDDHSERIAELFRADDFDKYVPKPYQAALIAIIKSSELPPTVTDNLARLKQSLEQPAVDRHVGEILLQILKAPAEMQDLALLGKNLKETIDFYLMSHDYAKIREVLSLCRREEIWQGMPAGIHADLFPEEFATTLLNDLNNLDRMQAEVAMELIVEIGPPFIAPLLDRLSVEINRSAWRLYMNLLIRLGEGCIPQIIGRLTASRWFVIRNMLFLLREFGNVSVLPHVRPFIKHPQPKVSQEALKICLTFRDRDVIPYLLTLLEGENDGDVIQALPLAALSDDPAVFNKLVTMLRKGSVFHFRLELKRAIIRALASFAEQKYLPVFSDILRARDFFHPKQLELLKLEVVAVLESRLAGNAVRRVLDEQANSGSAAVMRAARSALAKVDKEKL